MLRSASLLLAAGLACGSRTPAGGSVAAALPPDASIADAAAADAGPPEAGDAGDEAPAVLADAGLSEIGITPCEAVVARFLNCPGVDAVSKKQMAAASERWRAEAEKSAEARENLAATCLEIARMTEEMLQRLGC